MSPFMQATYESTIVFGADGRYSYLKYSTKFAWQTLGSSYLQKPRSDGTYTYQRTSDTTATIGLNGDDGSQSGRQLTFTSDTAGGVAYNWFTLTDAVTPPVSNVSCRGNVSPGHPLIVGFVVPGSPPSIPTSLSTPAAAPQREVLIRVIGPSLAQLGVTNTWADPDFRLYLGSSPAPGVEARYGDWTDALDGAPITSADTEAAFRKIFGYVGAFPLPSGSKDAAQVVRLDPGAYTIVASAGSGDPGGEALIEVYLLP